LKPTEQKLLIISRDTLLDALTGTPSETPSGHSVNLIFRLLARLSRRGFRLLLTASEPERWVPTRGNVDDALNRQSALVEQARSAGGELEGIYYVPRSLLTQDRNREGAIRDILNRYTVDASGAILISSSSPFVKAADRVGLATVEIAPVGKPAPDLVSALKNLDK
jgi:hypothetical protein